jgi:hypothetical protein
MFASYLSLPIALGLAGSIALACMPHSIAAPLCKPAFAFRDVRFSATQPETMERTWTAVLSVDASRCATASGRFEILFSRQKENGPEVTFAEPFTWKPGAMEVSVQFWADEAVEGFWLHNVAACPCRE